jgi:hypothetical protein
MRYLACCLCVVGLVGRADGAPAEYAGLKHLGPALGYVALRPLPIYEALQELRDMLGAKQKSASVLVAAGLARTFGFDPTSRAWVAAAGIDGRAPLLLSLYSGDATAARTANRQLEAAARRRSAAASTAAEGLPDRAPPIFVTHRLVATLVDAAKARRFLEELPAKLGAQRVVVLLGKSKTEVGPSVGALLGLADRDGEQLAAGLIDRGGAALLRPERGMIAVARLDGQAFLVVDLLEGWTGLPAKAPAAAVRRLLSATAGPARPGLDLDKHKLAARAFTGDAVGAALIAAKPCLSWAELVDERDLYLPLLSSTSKEAVAGAIKRARSCAAAWRTGQIPTGDLALQLKSTASEVHLKAYWAIPAATARTLRGAVAKQDLVDPTTLQSRVVAVAGSSLRLGAAAQALARGVFKLKPEELEAKVDGCPTRALATVSLGGWPHLLAIARGGARRHDAFAGVVDHLEQAVLIVRELYTLSHPSVMIRLQLAREAEPKLKEAVGKLLNQGSRPESQTVGGKPSTLYRYLKAPLAGFGLATTDAKPQGPIVSVTSRPWDLAWLLQQEIPASPILPRSVVAFAHVNLAQIVEALGRGPRPSVPAAVANKAAKRLGAAGANLSLVGDLLTADLHLTFK